MIWPILAALTTVFAVVAVTTFVWVFPPIVRFVQVNVLGSPQTINADLVLSGAAAVFAGLGVAFVADLALKWVLGPVFGPGMRIKPTVFSEVFRHEGFALGVTGRVAQDGRSYTLRLGHDGVAAEFADLNPAARPVA